MLLMGFSILMMNSMITAAVSSENRSYCPDNRPQRLLDLDEAMGIWYVVEIFEHGREASPISLRSCPTVHLGRESRSDLRLVWIEATRTFYYHVRINDMNSPGFWLSSGPFNGTTIDDDYSTRFTGTIQVMKVVADHMVLTFCRSERSSKIFSALLSRERMLTSMQTKGVISMLQRRGLETRAVKHACSVATKHLGNFHFRVILLLVVLFSHSV